MASEPDRPTDASPPRPRPGAITLARHGEPALSRRVRLNADGYRRWWAAYEEGGILPGQAPPEALLDLARRADVIWASPRRRAIETAEAVVGGRRFVRDPDLIEAPLPPPAFPAALRLKPRTWGFVARFAWWWFNHHAGEESQAQASARAKAVADKLVAAAQGGEVLVLAHGFFNAMIGRELKRRGWRLKGDGGFHYWSTRRYERG